MNVCLELPKVTLVPVFGACSTWQPGIMTSVSLCLGEPNFDTPAHIVDAAKESLDRGLTHYTPNAGLVESPGYC